jgi:hypothetical protein
LGRTLLLLFGVVVHSDVARLRLFLRTVTGSMAQLNLHVVK